MGQKREVPDKVRRIQELRRGNATSRHGKVQTRADRDRAEMRLQDQ